MAKKNLMAGMKWERNKMVGSFVSGATLFPGAMSVEIRHIEDDYNVLIVEAVYGAFAALAVGSLESLKRSYGETSLYIEIFGASKCEEFINKVNDILREDSP